MVSSAGIALGVALTLLAVAVDAYHSRGDGRRSAASRSEDPSSSTVGHVDASAGLARVVGDDEELQRVISPNAHAGVLAGVVATLTVGLPLGLVAGLFLWLVAGVLPGGDDLAGVALAVGSAAPPTALLLKEGVAPLFDRTEYAVTDQRLVACDGRARREREAVPLETLQDVTVETGRLRRMLDVGTVTASGDTETVTLERVENPDAVAAELEAMLADGA